MNTFDTTNKYWEIVSENNLHNILIPVAADYGRLKHVFRWLLSDEYYPDVSETHDYDELVDMITVEYGLLPNEVEAVCGLCENNVCNELKYGNKT